MANSHRILVLTASAGAGHTVAAAALQTVLRERIPQATVEVQDVLQATNPFFRALYAQGYLGLVNHAPTAMGMLYEATDRGNNRTKHWLRSTFQNANAHRFLHNLERHPPDLIINTHFLPAELVAHLRREGRLDCPQATVTTDFETHRLWAQPPTERYYTATPEGAAYLATWNVDPSTIHVTGIPIRPQFLERFDRAELRKRLGLDAGQPLVLLLCGGFGVGPTGELLDELLRLPGDNQIVAIAGRNEKLRVRLESAARMADGRARVLGYTDKIHEWMHAADLLVSKPGGLTAAEALACGLPLVIVSPIPGQESRNSDYLLENGAAIKVNNARLLGYRVRELLADATRLERLRESARRIARPDAAVRIVDDALHLLATKAG